MNIILRPLFNRPEMLQLSIKYETIAREYFPDDDYTTLFAIEGGADPKCLEIVDAYPFKKIVMQRKVRYGVCANIMEALKQAFSQDIEYVINMEDDLILHKTYFEFVNKAHKLTNGNYSVITSWGYNNTGSPSILRTTDYSNGPGVMINKNFFNNYMLEHATVDYYKNWTATIHKINLMNSNNPNAKYNKERGAFTHLDWDGLMNRLVDYTSYKNGVRGYSSVCNRLLHIGFFGFNRHGGKFPENLSTFEDRIKFLEENMFNAELLSALDGTYTDYTEFIPEIDAWDGTLVLE
jgi:hypothetical protein